MSYDLIGDIHGYADALERLLQTLGYREQAGVYSHPERQAIFVGDLIDRGPDIPRVLEIVKSMVDHEQALITMGNHEYNMLCFYSWHNGKFLRPHTPTKMRQARVTLEAFADRGAEWYGWLQWFWDMPLFLELDGLRAVHACWDEAQIAYLKAHLSDHRLTQRFLFESTQQGSRQKDAVEIVLKGREQSLPAGQVFYDKERTPRKESRVVWWAVDGKTWREHAIGIPETEETQPLLNTPFTPQDDWVYGPEQPPVFFGHYWMKGDLRLQAPNICCLDYSVAKQGRLCAYRWDGEQVLNSEKMRCVPAIQ